MFRDLIADGHSLLIYPEGGRSPDGWGQEFKGGAAYLSARTGAPIIPVFIDGTGPIFGKGMKRPKPGRTKVVFGAPLWPSEDENTRRFNARIEAAVTRLGDEALTDYWTATRRAAQGTNPTLTGPEYNGWRRQWELGEHRKLGAADRWGARRRELSSLGLGDALVIGLAQALALVPGTSRAGVTLTAALALGFRRPEAARFSFLLVIPVSVLAAGWDGLRLVRGEIPAGDLLPMAAAFAVAAVSAYLVIGWLLAWLQRHGVLPFVVYRVLVGLAVLALAG